MRSSTSSSEAALAAGGWGLTWLLALLLVAPTLAGWEVLLRANGHGPSVVDDPDLWCAWRERATIAGSLVLLGSSRIQLGIEPRRLAERLAGRRVVQLAVDGRAPFAALEDLAADPDFSGLVLVSIVESSLTRADWAGQAEYPAHCRQDWSFDRRLNRSLATGRQELLASANPNVGALRSLQFLLDEGRLPPPLWLLTRPDRSRAVDPEKIDLERLRAWRLERLRRLYAKTGPVDEAAWFEQGERLRAVVAKLRAHGARVVLLRLPTSGEHWRLDEERYPRSRFWDRLVEQVSAPAIHFRDVPAMAELTCYDCSHLDAPSARSYTDALARELLRLGALGP